MTRKRVAVLISGRGSNMLALVAAAGDPTYPAEIALVASNRPNAPGLAAAAARGIATASVDGAQYKGRRAEFEAEIERHLAAAQIDLVCLAGFMRLLSPEFVERWRDRLINIHPSLLPAFPGLDTHARAIAAKVPEHGCTVHFVRAEMDSGPNILQSVVPVLHDDTPDTLADRVLVAEHRLYPEALALVASGRAHVVGETVTIDAP
jgi:phosphoribosylglycinamide formyltransferase-1